MTSGTRMISNTLWATGWLGLTATLAFPQVAPDLASQKAQAEALEKKLPVPSTEARTNFDLSPARQERFQKLLPKAYRKLSQREPFNILILGDEEAFQVHEGKPAQSFPGVFATELATQFFYTGGVLESGTTGPLQAPTIALRTLTRPHGSVLDAAGILASTARQAPVDVVLICYGQTETSMSPVTYRRAIVAALAGAKEIGAEVILCSPWLPVAENCETVLGGNRPLADVLHEIATEEGLLHADLGDLSRIVRVPEVETQNEGQVFERIETTYRAFFHQAAATSYIPRLNLHQQLGSLIYKELLDAPVPLPWQASEATAHQTAADQLTLAYVLKNTGASDLDLTVLPLIAAGWKPVEAQSKISLKAGASQEIKVSYAQTGSEAVFQEPLVRFPVLVSAGPLVRVETLRAPVDPFAIVWGLETQFNQEAGFLAGCQIVNTGKPRIQGSWQAEFEGQKLNGQFDLQSGASSPLNLKLNLPADITITKRLPLKLTVQSEGVTRISNRTVVITPNLGLNQTARLLPLAITKTASPVSLNVKASAKALALTFDITGDEVLQDSANGGPAWQLEVNLDARSYGKRLEPGSTAEVLVTGKAAPGAGKVHPIPAWAFGTGYGAGFDPKEFKAALTGTEGKRQITLTLPRTYLYLHEWALDNGNSQLGLNVRLTLNGAEGYVTYFLSPTLKPADDVEALAVLELTAKPTRRVTVEVE